MTRKFETLLGFPKKRKQLWSWPHINHAHRPPNSTVPWNILHCSYCTVSFLKHTLRMKAMVLTTKLINAKALFTHVSCSTMLAGKKLQLHFRLQRAMAATNEPCWPHLKLHNHCIASTASLSQLPMKIHGNFRCNYKSKYTHMSAADSLSKFSSQTKPSVDIQILLAFIEQIRHGYWLLDPKNRPCFSLNPA